jgi:hypothetical protein
MRSPTAMYPSMIMSRMRETTTSCKLARSIRTASGKGAAFAGALDLLFIWPIRFSNSPSGRNIASGIATANDTSGGRANRRVNRRDSLQLAVRAKLLNHECRILHF